MRRLALLSLCALLGACSQDNTGRPGRRSALFVGIDVSGSFHSSPQYNDSMSFLARYLHMHLGGLAGSTPPNELFVGSIGGEMTDQAKSFRPIHDFQGKSVEQIEADLRAWFPKSDNISDFNVFFRQVAKIAEKRNLALKPITVMLVTDGIPAVPGSERSVEIGQYDKIDISPLEFLSRNVTLRLLYPSPIVSARWEEGVTRKRVRLWTVDAQVMSGWKAQLIPDAAPESQSKFFKWTADNVDYRVRPAKFTRPAKK